MFSVKSQAAPTRKDGRVILHFDYDCFYASVFESENPELKSKPLAVQQKQIVVTCNLVARQRGLRKLQLIKDAKEICPDVVIVLGEDISRFRDASKKLYRFLRAYSWNDRAERLGFDEVWLDVTDMIDYNMSLLNTNDLSRSFFMMAKNDPTKGFEFDATCSAGHSFPESNDCDQLEEDQQNLALRLRLGSHLASHIRNKLEQETGYTSSVGISTSKLLSKLVGNLHKPRGQTTLVPPYVCLNDQQDNVGAFMDDFEIGKVPGIGFKLALKIRQHVLQHEPDFEKGLVYGATKENVTVKDVRLNPEISPEILEKLLAGPGSPHGLGARIYQLLHGVDNTDVSFAKAVPSQISIEDSYIRLDTLPEVLKELKMLSCSLIERMRIDLVSDDEDDEPPQHLTSRLAPQVANEKPQEKLERKWLAHPRTVRLSTRPRLPLNPDGTRQRSFKRISHSAPLPNFVFSLTDSVDVLADRLVREALISMFRKLHPEKAGWNLSLVNVAVTNMAETGSESRTADGRDIGNMFKRQESVHKEFRVYDDEAIDNAGQSSPKKSPEYQKTHGVIASMSGLPDGCEDSAWVDEDVDCGGERCEICSTILPSFAMPAHRRYHLLGE